MVTWLNRGRPSRPGRAVVVALALTLIALVAAPAPANAVIGGKKAKYGPWAVRMLLDGQAHCTGTAVTREWIILASHCFFEQGQPVADRRISFRVGSLNQSEGTRTKPVRGSRVADPALSDVMMIKVPKMKGVKPAKLGTAKVKAGRLVRVYGWGATCTTDENKCQANNLRQADVRVRSPRYDGCEYYVGPDKRDFCATAVKGIPAGGDSGGPVMTIAPRGKERLVGVFWGSDRERMIGAAAIAPQLKWIRSVIQ